MQTFAPYASCADLAWLDDKRLFNQFNEHKVIWSAVVYDAKPWHNHPACVMWRGFVKPGARWTADRAPYGPALAHYGLAVQAELKHRGLRWGLDHHARLLDDIELHFKHSRITYPEWWGEPDFHLAHRRNLVRKYQKHYARFGVEPSDVYVWPIQREDGSWEMRTKRVGNQYDYEPGRILKP